MNLQPISPSPYTASGSPFKAICSKCSRVRDSPNLAADLDGAPWTYVCWAHWEDAGVGDAIRQAHGQAFKALSPQAQHCARTIIYGRSETRAIEDRVRRQEL